MVSVCRAIRFVKEDFLKYERQNIKYEKCKSVKKKPSKKKRITSLELMQSR